MPTAFSCSSTTFPIFGNFANSPIIYLSFPLYISLSSYILVFSISLVHNHRKSNHYSLCFFCKWHPKNIGNNFLYRCFRFHSVCSLNHMNDSASNFLTRISRRLCGKIVWLCMNHNRFPIYFFYRNAFVIKRKPHISLITQ